MHSVFHHVEDIVCDACGRSKRCARELDIWREGCHPFASLRAGSERSEGSGKTDAEILRCAQDDSQALRMTGRTPHGAAHEKPSLQRSARELEMIFIPGDVHPEKVATV